MLSSNTQPSVTCMVVPTYSQFHLPTLNSGLNVLDGKLQTETIRKLEIVRRSE